MSVDFERGRPTEEIAIARDEYGPHLPENVARELAEVALAIEGAEHLEGWNMLAMAYYPGFKGVVAQLVTGPRGRIIENRAKMWLLEVSERYDEQTLFGY